MAELCDGQVAAEPSATARELFVQHDADEVQMMLAEDSMKIKVRNLD